MPVLERFPISTAVVVAGWNNPTNAYAFDNSYADSSTNNAEQSFDYFPFIEGSEVIDKVYVRIKYNLVLTGVLVGDAADCTFSVKVYDGTSWTAYQVTRGIFACTTANDESFTDTIGNDSNSVVAIDVSTTLNTAAKLNAAQTSVVTVLTADAGLTPQVKVDCVSVLACFHTVGDVFIGRDTATTRRDVDRKEFRALKKVSEALKTVS